LTVIYEVLYIYYLFELAVFYTQWLPRMRKSEEKEKVSICLKNLYQRIQFTHSLNYNFVTRFG
jgi:hypothetical protein